MAAMNDRINDDFTQKVWVQIDQQNWVPSPITGVERKPLDRIGAEVGRATSVVRFLPGNSFSPHTHGGGEEFLVLKGVFSDETGDYGPLSYVRNPPGSAHTPFSKDGCEIFVKLCQMKASGEPAVTIKADELDFEQVAGQEGLWRKPLFSATEWFEEVAIEKREAGAPCCKEVFESGAEILVLSGVLKDGDVAYPAHSWVRFPKGGQARLHSDETVVYWIKRGIDFSFSVEA